MNVTFPTIDQNLKSPGLINKKAKANTGKVIETTFVFSHKSKLETRATVLKIRDCVCDKEKLAIFVIF